MDAGGSRDSKQRRSPDSSSRGLDRAIEAIVRANNRTPDLVVGDIRGEVGVARLGERRVAELFERYGGATVLAAFAHMQDVTERRIRTVRSISARRSRAVAATTP